MPCRNRTRWMTFFLVVGTYRRNHVQPVMNTDADEFNRTGLSYRLLLRYTLSVTRAPINIALRIIAAIAEPVAIMLPCRWWYAVVQNDPKNVKGHRGSWYWPCLRLRKLRQLRRNIGFFSRGVSCRQFRAQSRHQRGDLGLTCDSEESEISSMRYVHGKKRYGCCKYRAIAEIYCSNNDIWFL